MGFIDFECLVIMWFTCFSWNICLFYFLLEGFRTNFQVFHKTSCGILHMVEFTNMLYYFKLIFENPYPSKGGWLGDHALYAHYWKSILNMCMKWVVGSMSYTLDLIVFSIDIIVSFQLVSLLIFFLYTHIFYICMLKLQIISISIGIYLSIHIYVFYLCLLYLYIFEHRFWLSLIS